MTVAYLSTRPKVTAQQALESAARLMEDMGLLYIGAIEIGDKPMEEVLAPYVGAARIAWHYPAQTLGLRPGEPPLPPSIADAAFLAKILEVDEVFRTEGPLDREWVARMLEACVDQLVALADSASEDLRNTNFSSFQGVAHVDNPTLQDFLGLQILRVLTVRDFMRLEATS